MSNVVTNLVQLIVPQPCYDKFFVDLNFFNVPCLKIILSKGLGYGIILGSVLVKIPQIVSIQKCRSAEGISRASLLLEIFSLMSSLAYGFAMGYAFSSYGEALFLHLQTWFILHLSFKYSDVPASSSTSSGFHAGIIAILSLLCSGAAPLALLKILQALVMPISSSARLTQAATNWKNGSTGQLSLISQTLLFFGSLARIFTSIQETGDTLILLTFVVSSVCNGLIFAQIIYYWPTKTKKTTKIG